MPSSDTVEKENVSHATEVVNGKKSCQPSSASILKPTRRANNLIDFSPIPNVLTKSSSKVTFKNTPVRHQPPRYRVEDLPPCWEELRKLDEVENWTEHTSVVTKEEHQEYLEAARAILEELIGSLPCVRDEEATGTMSTEADADEKLKKKPRQRFVKPVRPKGQKSDGDFFIDFGLGSPQADVTDSNPEPSSLPEERPSLIEPNDANAEAGFAVEKASSLEELGLSEKCESSDSNRLQVNTDESPKTFSPIGSERTSPELENLTGSSNEDISKLLMPHDDLADNGSSQVQDSVQTPVSPSHADDLADNSSSQVQDSVQTPLSPSHADDLLQQMTSLKSQTSQLAEIFASETSQLLEKSDGSTDTIRSTESDSNTGVDGSAGEQANAAEKTFENLGTSDAADDEQLIDGTTGGSVNTSAEPGGAAELTSVNEDDATGAVAAACELKQATGFEDQSAEVFGLTDDDFKSANNDFSLELDYLEKCGSSSDMDKLSALARQSLYVKFDPLVKGSNSPQIRTGPLSSNLGGGDLLQMNTPPHQVPRSLAARLAAMKKEKDNTHESLQGVDQLLNFSPAPKPSCADTTDDVLEVTDPGAASTSAGNSKLDLATDDSHLVQPLLYCKADLEVAVKKEREAVLSQAQEESAIREMEIQELEKKLQQQTSENMKLKKDNDELKQVMLEYEKTMAEMIETGQKSQSEHDVSTDEVKKERDQIQADLNSVEAAFSDLHRRYEKLKGAVENYKKNEAILLKTAKDYQEKLKRSEEKYLMLKKHAEEKIEVANVEISRVRKSNESEMAVMKAALKKEQTRVLSLEQTLQQKVHENKELTAICDELISRVGGK